MKAKFIQKILAGAMAASLILTPVIGVNASSGNNNGQTPGEVVTQIVTNSTNGEVTSIAQIPATSSVAGVKSTVRGVYLATSVRGTAILSDLTSLKGNYGLTGSETPYAKIANMDKKKSNLAYSAMEQAAAANGAVVGPCINIELGKMSNGKYSLLSQDGAAIRLSVGIPKNFVDSNATYAMVCVRPGGVVSILQDVDTNPETVTFDTAGGAGAYAIIKY